VAVSSSMLPLGTLAPAFSLPDVVSGRLVTLADVASSRPVLVMFICRHCPFVKHVEHELANIGRDYGDRLGIVAISSNDIASYPDDAPSSLREQAETVGFVFPYLFDETQEVGKAYHAACTPDFFLFDRNRHLVYRGQLDDSRPSNKIPVTGRDLRTALDAVLAGGPVDPDQRASVGCSIKWKA
jgi:thiol-disulfide isomerase/thioredoxin